MIVKLKNMIYRPIKGKNFSISGEFIILLIAVPDNKIIIRINIDKLQITYNVFRSNAESLPGESTYFGI